ncbi:insulin-like receptor [Drosophila busckii]|uniref:insulin-like receptor n=1 Tax=Drosophila busckii TaxID=30019 RepID=UPI001432CF2F|nr:insulin-like receptor [Drosophila busckii]
MQMLLQHALQFFNTQRRPTPRWQQHKQRHQHQQQQQQLQRIVIVCSIISLLNVAATATAAAAEPSTEEFERSLEALTRSVRSADVSQSHSNASNAIDKFASSSNSSSSHSSINFNTKPRMLPNQTPCKSIDVRNKIANMEKLANCTVIEGFLMITLINDADKLNRSYPLLTEVTGYVIVFRVQNLKSLSDIFPNLNVIRGNILFEGYALIFYSNRDMQNIGLGNLRAISNGGVRIEKNYYLCYVHTVNWRQILPANATDADIVIKYNRNKDECNQCPSETESGTCREQNDGRRYCWSSKACQTICPARCRRNCIDENTCCDENCLGSCSRATANGASNCISCRNVSMAHQGNEHCIDACPAGTFLYEQRCITAAQCENLDMIFVNTKEVKLVHNNGKCTTRCDKGFAVSSNHTCQKCDGRCERWCEGGVIDSLVQAKEYQGCTIIGNRKGLTISVKRGGSHMLEALTNGLGWVHTINTYLKVHLTYGLVSLDFFQSLRTIRGITPLEDLYALYVLENNDLDHIWAPNQSVTIGNASVFFHFNPKLCIEKINQLLPMVASKPKEFNKNEVAEDSNGNKGTCNTKWLNVTVDPDSTHFNVNINASLVHYDDERSLIGYIVSFALDPYNNVTKESIEPCDDTWTVMDPDKSTSQKILATAYTYYTLYVRTKTISMERRNYQSQMIRFKTKAAQPEMVKRLKADVKNSSSILLSWERPALVNGVLDKYQIRAELLVPENKADMGRNFCRNPEVSVQEKQVTYMMTDTEMDADAKRSDVCNCARSNKNSRHDDSELKRLTDIDFENALQNFIYVSRTKVDNFNLNISLLAVYEKSHSVSATNVTQLARSRRHLYEPSAQLSSVMTRSIRAVQENVTHSFPPVRRLKVPPANWLNKTMDAHNRHYVNFSIELGPNVTEFEFTKLRHFSIYALTVTACRKSEGPQDYAELCSDALPWKKRTRKRDNADVALNLTGNLVEGVNSTRGSVRLRWQPPTEPNGDVVSYTIFYELQEHNSYGEKRCFPVQDYKNQSEFIVANLAEGRYAFQVRANSLAGEGNLTEPIYVEVPPPSSADTIIISIVVSIVLLVLVAAAVYTLYHMRKKRHPGEFIMNTAVNPAYASLQYVPDDWEVPRERIIQLSSLGQGSFGMVYEGLLKSQGAGEDTPCAIKTVNENATDRERVNFLSEASVMKSFKTYHVVRLLGVCSRGQPALVVMELMIKGDLKSYLRAHRPDEHGEALTAYQRRIGFTNETIPQPPTYSRIYQMALEIADGMAYLSAKKFVHRDLAARNCMVADDLTVKIGDFGMTRDIYETDYYRKGTKGLLPVRWMPPESLRDGVYSSASDVFSYGVVLWEMATLASQPYQGLSNEQVLRYVIEGGIMQRPENCPELLHRLMHRCWHHRPTARPTFLEIIAYLEQLSDPLFKEVAFYYTELGAQKRDKERLERNPLELFEGDMEDATTPLRVGEYDAGYKSNMEHNASLEQPAESPIALVDDEQTNTHMPFSLHSGFIVSSTPDALSTLPTSGGSHMEDAAYVQPDADTDAERGYEPYDPSPQFVVMPHSAGAGSGKLSGEQHLLPKLKRGTNQMSNSMPEDGVGSAGTDGTGILAAASSLQPSTASAASSNASSSGRNPSMKRAVVDTFRNRGYNFLNRFNHRRSGSNASHKSNASNAPSTSSNTNLTSCPADMAMVTMGPPNLGTIESGGSGSAGSYAGTPNFYTPTASTPSGLGSGRNGGSSAMISENPNYQKMDEPALQLTTSSLNPNYEIMQPTGNANSNAAATISDNPNYVLMGESQPAPNIYTSNNPNYAAMHCSSSDEAEDNDEDDEHDLHGDEQSERMPLSRLKQQPRIRPTQQQQPPRSRSASRTRKAETPVAAVTPTVAAAAGGLPQAGHTSNILKENWLRQASTPRPPPPNGFIGREA